jgi:MSHA biogenesis protein MshN
MSVVNKMLQDLEARKSQTEAMRADYHAPPKKQSKSLILLLLILTIVAITFTLINRGLLFGENKDTEVAASLMTNKMTVVTKKVLQAPLQQQITATQTSETQLKPLVISPIGISNNPVPLQNIETQDKQLASQSSSKISTRTTAEQTSSFSMSGSSQENNTSNLKQRIAENLDNDSFDLAQSLLGKLLVIEPNNIKARKKLASLLFAQGNYEQSKQLLIQGIELHPTQSDLRLMLARLYVVQKESAQAMSILAEFQPDSDNQTEYLAYRASLAQQLKQAGSAKSDYQTLTDIEPNNARWWLGLAIVRDQSDEITMALQAYNKAYKLGQLDSSVNNFIQQRISVLIGAQ